MAAPQWEALDTYDLVSIEEQRWVWHRDAVVGRVFHAFFPGPYRNERGNVDRRKRGNCNSCLERLGAGSLVQTHR